MRNDRSKELCLCDAGVIRHVSFFLYVIRHVFPFRGHLHLLTPVLTPHLSFFFPTHRTSLKISASHGYLHTQLDKTSTDRRRRFPKQLRGPSRPRSYLYTRIPHSAVWKPCGLSPSTLHLRYLHSYTYIAKYEHDIPTIKEIR